MSTYSFNKSCDSQKLKKEIEDSSIVTALDYIETTASQTYVHFKATLSGGDETTLNSLITAHVNEPLPENQATLVEFKNHTSELGLPKFASYEPEGDFLTFATHDFTDKTSWYGDALEAVNETLTVDQNNASLYYFANTNIIDLTHGKVTKEDELDYPIVIRDNGVVQTTGFTIDYDAGSVLFVGTPTGPVTADYFYEAGSTFVIEPAAGQKLILRHAEVQFTKDVRMVETYFDIYVYNPNDLPNKVLYERVTYKNIKDLLNVANLAFSTPAFHDLTDSLMVFPFDYARAIILNSSVGAELRIHTKNDAAYTKNPQNGSISFATVSLYCGVEDE